MGSKNRHAKELLSIILKQRNEGQFYVEPFVGGCNIIDKVDGNRIGNDSHPYLIGMWKAIQKGWTPPYFVTEEQYQNVRRNKHLFTREFVSFVGFGCSYSGKWFGGYARGKSNSGIERNYASESAKNIENQIPSLKNIQFFEGEYYDIEMPPNSIIYCDPPYEGTTSYKDKFDHVNFWHWCRKMKEIGHIIFISEYNAPPDFICVWSKVVNNTLVKETGSKQGTEKLFTL